LAATTSGPAFGTFSMPRIVRPKRTRQSKIMNNRKRSYLRDILCGVLLPLNALVLLTRPS
jgi:hypothetical protein